MKKLVSKKTMRERRAKKSRHHIKLLGVERDTARLSLHRSGKHIYAQVIAPVGGSILASASSLELRKDNVTLTKSEKSKKVAEILAERIKNAEILSLACDRSGFKYHGRVAALVSTLRENGVNV
jgi:large subunit ribosomal protein L18